MTVTVPGSSYSVIVAVATGGGTCEGGISAGALGSAELIKGRLERVPIR